jgi:hypothetical protein
MGKHKQELELTRESWDRKASSEGYRCAVCSALINYDEREQYFSTNMCGIDARQAEKNN